jgi:ABC-2 type transport system ATP-binding protein
MIEINHLTHYFGSKKVIDDLSFSVGEGEVLGFLGPNGAGKSTTMKILTGFLAPSSGSIRVCGFDMAIQGVRAREMMGYLPEGAPGYGEMQVGHFLGFIAAIRKLQGNARKTAIDRVVEQLQLHSVFYQTLDTLSKGFRRRVGLAQALLHDPKVLILDEPTDGLDPNQKHQVRELIRSLAEDKIVIVSTHILEEVGAVCSRAIIINRGKLVVDESPEVLQARSPDGRLDDVFRELTLGEAA